tara:strand:- start:639 stop:1154 length:516 start_codon:yes stop_codon:yes gene_type:complete
MATFKGKAVFWGSGNFSFAGFTTSSDFDFFNQSASFTKGSNEKLIRDYDGDVISAVYSDPVREFTFEVIPSSKASSGQVANAKANADLLMPDIGSKITLTDLDSNETDENTLGGTSGGTDAGGAEEFDGGSSSTREYTVRSASMTRSNESEARITITAYTSDAAAICDTIT